MLQINVSEGMREDTVKEGMKCMEAGEVGGGRGSLVWGGNNEEEEADVGKCFPVSRHAGGVTRKKFARSARVRLSKRGKTKKYGNSVR